MLALPATDILASFYQTRTTIAADIVQRCTGWVYAVAICAAWALRQAIEPARP